MDIKRSGSQPSAKGPAEYFTGSVRIDPLFEAPDLARPRVTSVTLDPGGQQGSGGLISAIAKRKQCDPGNLNRSSRWN